MSLQSQPIGPIPAETVRVVLAAFPKGNTYMQIRDELGTIYENAASAELFSILGPRSKPPWRLLLVAMRQFAEGL